MIGVEAMVVGEIEYRRVWQGERRSTVKPEQNPELDRTKVRTRYGIDKGRRVKC